MREAARVFSEASSLTTNEQPLTFSTSPMTVRVTSRSVMDFSCDRVSTINGSRIKAACPFFSSARLKNNSGRCFHLWIGGPQKKIVKIAGPDQDAEALWPREPSDLSFHKPGPMRLNPPARLRALGFRRSARLLRKGLRPLLLPL